MREEKYHRLFRTLLTIVVAVSLSGCDWVLFDSKGQIGIEQRIPEQHLGGNDRGMRNARYSGMGSLFGKCP